ncbi:MAG: class I SAM-dependent methyltransferase [Clostridia bacterium]|nr:class I SAM-dependent methyltransferase [Clostridia bacterium]
MNKDYNVFICYRGESGGEIASSIYSDLCTFSKNKLKLFFAPKCLKYGENFMTDCKEVAGQVALMILILTPNFFDGCKNKDDVVHEELKAALSNPNTAFLPIKKVGFEFNDELLEELFNESEIDRIKHISAITYNDVYSFKSMELLLPILEDKVGVTDYDEVIQRDLESKQLRTKKRVHIHTENKTGFFSQDNKMEARRLETQQKLLYDFDMPSYEKYLSGKKDLNVLDIGCGNGRALMARLGNREEVSKIIGVEFDESFVAKAKADYERENVKFYQADVESEDFDEQLEEIMEENGIEKFDWINILAVMSHLKSPHKLLKRLRSYCKHGAVIYIRNIDDGLNIAYPDENFMFERAFNMIAKCDTTGYRRSGRELYTILQRSGYKDISVEKLGLNSAGMDYDEKEAFFRTVFHFLKNSINVTYQNDPRDKEIRTEKEWLDEYFDDLEEKFLSPDFFVNFGFLIVCAKV